MSLPAHIYDQVWLITGSDGSSQSAAPVCGENKGNLLKFLFRKSSASPRVPIQSLEVGPWPQVSSAPGSGKDYWRQDSSRRLWRSLIKPSCRLSKVVSNQRRGLWDMSSDYCVRGIDVNRAAHPKAQQGEKQPIICLVSCMCWERHTQTQSLRGELPGSSRCLLWSQQLPHQKHPDISFHIHNYMMKGEGSSGGSSGGSSEAFHTCRWWKVCKAQQKNTPLRTFFAASPLAGSFHYVVGRQSGTEQRRDQAPSAAFSSWPEVQEMIKYTYSLLFISAHPLCISMYY